VALELPKRSVKRRKVRDSDDEEEFHISDDDGDYSGGEDDSVDIEDSGGDDDFDDELDIKLKTPPKKPLSRLKKGTKTEDEDIVLELEDEVQDLAKARGISDIVAMAKDSRVSFGLGKTNGA